MNFLKQHGRSLSRVRRGPLGCERPHHPAHVSRVSHIGAVVGAQTRAGLGPHTAEAGDGMKNTLKILHGMKSTLKSPNLGITLETPELPLGLKITLRRPENHTNRPVLVQMQYIYVY